MSEKFHSKLVFAAAGLIFFGGVIVWTLVYGKPENSLHVSAQSWSFMLCAGLFAGIGFGAIAHLIPGFKAPEKSTPATTPPPVRDKTRMKRKLGKKGLDLIKSFESFVPYVYDDLIPPVKGKYREWNGGAVKGTLTIGYGHTDAAKHPLKIERGLKISQARALEILDVDLDECEEAVDRLVRVSLTQGQFDALVSFAFNCGTGNLRKSSLLRKLNAGDYDGARACFDLYTRSKGKVLRGLVRRRDAEQALWGDTADGVLLPEEPVTHPAEVDAPIAPIDAPPPAQQDDAPPQAAPEPASRTGISEGAKVGIGAGFVGLLTQAWEVLTQAPETLLQAMVAATQKPAFWIFAVVIGACVYVWHRRSQQKVA